MTLPPAVRLTLLRQMNMRSLTCVLIWVRAVYTQELTRRDRKNAPSPCPLQTILLITQKRTYASKHTDTDYVKGVREEAIARICKCFKCIQKMTERKQSHIHYLCKTDNLIPVFRVPILSSSLNKKTKQINIYADAYIQCPNRVEGAYKREV